jgi:general secretion pathway protein L
MTAAADHAPKRLLAWARIALSWWLGELLGLGRDVARLVPIGREGTATVEAGERYWIVRGRGAVLGQIDCDEGPDALRVLKRLVKPGRQGRSVIVELPPERVLARRVDFPAVSRTDLKRLLRFEIARHFPFPAERAQFAYRLLPRRDPASDRIEIEIVAVPRETVAEIRAALASAGIAAARIIVPGGAGGMTLDAEDAPPRGAAYHALVAALVALTIAALASPIVRDRMELAALNGEIAAIAPAAQSAMAAREQRRSAEAQLAAPLRLAAGRPPLVAVLDNLTKGVPDGAWLQSLAISGDQVTLDGLAPSAASIALALEKSGAVGNVAFRSAIARDPASGLEHFTLAATIIGGKP